MNFTIFLREETQVRAFFSSRKHLFSAEHREPQVISLGPNKLLTIASESGSDDSEPAVFSIV